MAEGHYFDMKKRIVNRPKISKWIGRMYTGMTIFMAVLFTVISLESDIVSSPLRLQAAFLGLMAFIVGLMALTTYSFHKTKYVLQGGCLYAWSPFAVIRLKTNEISRIDKLMIPFHIRFGASLYSGSFYIPHIGWTTAIITNLTDGLLITTKGGRRYLITPSNPVGFAKLLNGSKRLVCSNPVCLVKN